MIRRANILSDNRAADARRSHLGPSSGFSPAMRAGGWVWRVGNGLGPCQSVIGVVPGATVTDDWVRFAVLGRGTLWHRLARFGTRVGLLRAIGKGAARSSVAS